MDSCQVSPVALLLRSEGFDHYHCDRNVSMGMDLANMAKTFKCAANDGILTVKADDDPTDSVTFTFMIPIVISVTNEVRFFTAGYISDGDNIRKPDASLDKPEESITIETQKSVKLTFSLRYMNSFAKATPLASQVTISLSSNQAGIFEYKIADIGYLRFYLAPKHEEEEY